jgi:hypothetical protein
MAHRIAIEFGWQERCSLWVRCKRQNAVAVVGDVDGALAVDGQARGIEEVGERELGLGGPPGARLRIALPARVPSTYF